MHSVVEKLNLVKNKVNDIVYKKQLKIYPNIIVVTKKFPFNTISPLLKSGHIHYGENKVQEAENKWAKAKSSYKNLQLHMVGKLQTNKAIYNRSNQTAMSKANSKFQSEGTVIVSEGFEIIENGNIIFFNGKTKLNLVR